MYWTHLTDIQAQSKKTPYILQLTALFATLLIFLSGTVLAGSSAYTWTDANGQVHFGDRPPAGAAAEQVEIRVNTYSAPPMVEPLDFETAEEPRQTRQTRKKKVVIYTTSRCGYCVKAKKFMAANKIPYTEYDVENSSRGRADYRKLKGRGVPIILVGKERMNGFSEGQLTSMLRNAGYSL